MPYITQEKRKEIQIYTPGRPHGLEEPGNDEVHLIDVTKIEKVGDMNFAISTIMRAWLDNYGHSYTNYNAMVGVLACASMELYRRLAAPYEDEKIKENGDVY